MTPVEEKVTSTRYYGTEHARVPGAVTISPDQTHT